MRKNKTKNRCEKYGQAITNYVLGENMGMTKEALFEHLKTCKNCRRDLTEWRDTYSVMKTEAYYQTPAGKAKMKRSFADVQRQVAAATQAKMPKGKSLSIGVMVRKPAGVVWNTLARHKVIKMADLPDLANLPVPVAYSALGWLAKENKLRMTGTTGNPFIYLPRREREIYQQRQAQV